MLPIYMMDDSQWRALLQDTAAAINDLTIKRGFQYFKQGRVRQFSMPDAGQIQAVVQGSEDYNVVLNLDELPESRCACPIQQNCKHIAAVLMEYADRQNRPVTSIVNVNSTALFQSAGKPGLAARSGMTAGKAAPAAGTGAGSQAPVSALHSKAALFVQFKVLAESLPERPIAAWHELFQRCIDAAGVGSSNTYFTESALNSLMAIKPPLSGGMEQLYQLHIRLFLLGRLVPRQRPAGTPGSTYMGYHTQMAADEIKTAIDGLLQEGLDAAVDMEAALKHPVAEAESPVTNNSSLVGARIQETLDDLRDQMLSQYRQLEYYPSIYYGIWQFWISPRVHGKPLYREELDKLQQAGSSLEEVPASARLPLHLAAAWMHFYLDEDDLALAELQTADRTHSLRFPPEQLLPFTRRLAENQAWSRLPAWLEGIAPLLSGVRSGQLKEYTAQWLICAEQVPGAEALMWSALRGMLPSTATIYQELLLARGRWREWMDYQLSAGKEPLEYRVTELQPLEKEAPELLLPFYHQAVERYVLQKNRSSYKSAVKLLKRLAKLYKKLKQQERWDAYIEGFAVRHSRLRALQEEIRKGKLLS
ncbi:hypothetical protein Q5741_17410 [Paenibacillus sp. JX-17]|uniref:SWIM-type domain-containing protein n=1 Tax=Paenibacillus lacisoli TaxID=3064525 RepID=A0ABT9CHS4_9BACL|nr:SWIM zinc finger family protein [Paenibacillus sp. JX-17]MDO7908184.1 hypothetical protein [Paenibacillus sp. JX-17]